MDFLPLNLPLLLEKGDSSSSDLHQLLPLEIPFIFLNSIRLSQVSDVSDPLDSELVLILSVEILLVVDDLLPSTLPLLVSLDQIGPILDVSLGPSSQPLGSELLDLSLVVDSNLSEMSSELEVSIVKILNSISLLLGSPGLVVLNLHVLVKGSPLGSPDLVGVVVGLSVDSNLLGPSGLPESVHDSLLVVEFFYGFFVFNQPGSEFLVIVRVELLSRLMDLGQVFLVS